MLKKSILIATLVYLAILMVNPASATADASTRIQTGTVTVSAIQQNVTISPVNISAAYVISSSRASASSDGATLRVMSQLLNATTISFTKFTALESADVVWQVVEDPDLIVQRGRFAYTTELNVNATLSPVVNLSNSFVINSVALNVASNLNLRGFWRSSFVNASRITNTRAAGTSGGNLAWQVVSWKGATVQNGSLTISGANNISSTVINAVNTSNTFVLATNDCNTNGANICWVSTYLKNATNLTSDRFNKTTGITVIQYYVISEPTLNVQNGTTALSGVLTVNATLGTVVNTTRTFAASTWSADTAGGTWLRNFQTYIIGNGSTLRFNKMATADGVFNNWFAITFQDVPAVNDCAYTTGNYNLPCGCNVTTNIALAPPAVMQNLSINGTGTTVITANITNVAYVKIAGINSTSQCNVILANGAKII